MSNVICIDRALKERRDRRLPSSPPKVTCSPVGSGILTGFSAAGYPKVNEVAVTWCELEGGGMIGYRPEVL